MTPSTPCQICGRPGRRYMNHDLCGDCRWWPEPPRPDPALTLDGIRASSRIRFAAAPGTIGQAIDERAIASGKRRASDGEFRAARAQLEHRAAVRGS